MNTLYFDIYNYNVEVKSSDTPLKHLKINSELAEFTVSKPEDIHLRILIAELPVLFRKGIYIGRTKRCEVRQVSLSKRQLIYEKIGRTLAIVNDDTSEPVRQIDLLVQNQEITDEILFDLIRACAREYLEGQQTPQAFPFFANLRLRNSWEFSVRPNNIKTIFQIMKNRRVLAKEKLKALTD